MNDKLPNIHQLISDMYYDPKTGFRSPQDIYDKLKQYGIKLKNSLPDSLNIVIPLTPIFACCDIMKTLICYSTLSKPWITQVNTKNPLKS